MHLLNKPHKLSTSKKYLANELKIHTYIGKISMEMVLLINFVKMF